MGAGAGVEELRLHALGEVAEERVVELVANETGVKLEHGGNRGLDGARVDGRVRRRRELHRRERECIQLVEAEADVVVQVLVDLDVRRVGRDLRGRVAAGSLRLGHLDVRVAMSVVAELVRVNVVVTVDVGSGIQVNIRVRVHGRGGAALDTLLDGGSGGAALGNGLAGGAGTGASALGLLVGVGVGAMVDDGGVSVSNDLDAGHSVALVLSVAVVCL